eukprot:7991454-Alexandrium_andersonii.AAC.1
MASAQGALRPRALHSGASGCGCAPASCNPGHSCAAASGTRGASLLAAPAAPAAPAIPAPPPVAEAPGQARTAAASPAAQQVRTLNEMAEYEGLADTLEGRFPTTRTGRSHRATAGSRGHVRGRMVASAGTGRAAQVTGHR